jgi:acetylornithine deacetylase
LILDLAEAGIRPAGCVVGEPTSMQPIIAHKGTHRFRCRVRGREAHSSYVTQGVNAIEYAARLVVFIRQLADRLAQLEARNYGFTVPYTTLSTGTIRGGIAANVVPKDCEFQFDVRTLPSASIEQIHGEIEAFARQLAAQMAKEDSDSGIELVRSSSTEGLNATEQDEIVQYAMRLTGNHTTGKVSYGTEAGLFQSAGIPSVICGPGDIAQAHRPNEFVALDELARCERFMDQVLASPYREEA